MTLLESLTAGVVSLFLTGLGFNQRSLNRRVLEVERELEKKASREDIAELIDIKQEALKQSSQATREDIQALHRKLDKLIDRYIDSK